MSRWCAMPAASSHVRQILHLHAVLPLHGLEHAALLSEQVLNLLVVDLRTRADMMT
jgi:hypothetical protein